MCPNCSESFARILIDRGTDIGSCWFDKKTKIFIVDSKYQKGELRVSSDTGGWTFYDR